VPASDILTSDDAAHFLRRVGFGGTDTEIAALAGLTRQQAVDHITDLSAAPAVSRPFSASEDWWDVHRIAHGWWIDRMATTPTPLQEKMTLFWHSHFAVGVRKVDDMVATWDQVQLLRAGCLGAFESLCQQVAVSPAMLVYLDNETNVVGVEQENFARELMELHTVGVGAFTEADVVAMAKAWTGYNTHRQHFGGDDISFRFEPSAHDNSQKTIMGTTRNWSGPETITELCIGAGRAATSAFVARKLWRFLVQTDPSAGSLDTVASAFSSSDLDIETLVRGILLHDDFWAPAARYALVKSPVEFIVDLIRRFGMRVDVAGDGDGGTWIAGDSLFWLMSYTGQQLFEPPNVNGWGVGTSWLSTATMWARARILSSLRWRTSDMNLFGDPGEPGALRHMTPAAGVQRILDLMGVDNPSTATRSHMESWFTTTQSHDSWAIHPNAVMVAGLSPEFQLT
jgi:uncharacterized protein (DUF1800 family)